MEQQWLSHDTTTASEGSPSNIGAEIPEPKSIGPDLDDLEVLKKTISEKSQLIKVEKVIYDKPAAVIYNPASGKRKDIRKKIQER